MPSTGPCRPDRHATADRRRSSTGRLGLVALLGLALALPAVALLAPASAANANPRTAVLNAADPAAAPPASAPALDAAPASDLLTTLVTPLTGNGDGTGGFGKPGNGSVSFGLQPAGPKAVDKRPDYTYRDLRPGQLLVDHVAVVNLNTAPLTVDVYPADAFNTAQGGFDVLSRGKPSKDLGTWIQLGHSSATVPARSTLIMAFTVRVPRNAEPGDHAAGIVASLTTTSKDKKGNIVSVDNRTGMRVFARVAGPLHPRIELDRHDARYRMGVVNGKADVTYTVKNTGNVRLVGKQSIRVSNLFGMSSHAIDVPELPELLPGNEFSFTRPVDGVFPTFLNTAYITVDPQSITGNVDPASEQVSARTMFFAMSWPLLVVIVLILVVGGWYLRRWWHRRRATSGPGSWGDGDGGTPPGRQAGPNGGRSVSVPPAAEPRQGAGVVTRVRALAAVALGAGLIVLPSATAAQAASDGTLTFLPGNGVAGVALYSVTSGPCPKEATNMVGYVYGKGFPAAGGVALSNQTAVIGHDGPFGIPLRDNMLNIAKEYGVKTLSGPYQVVMKCIDTFNLTTFAQFTGTLTFDNPNHFTAPVPAKAPAAGVPMGYLAQVFPAYKQALIAQNTNGSGEAAPPTSPKASGQAAAPQALAGEQQADQGSGHAAVGANLGWLVAGGIAAALLAFAGAALIRQRSAVPAASPAGGAKVGAKPAVSWPEERPATEGKAKPLPGPRSPAAGVKGKPANGTAKTKTRDGAGAGAGGGDNSGATKNG